MEHSMSYNANKLRRVCAQFVNLDTEETPINKSHEEASNYTNKIRESCRKMNDGQYSTKSKQSNQYEIPVYTSTGKRHHKFLLAKLELQKLKGLASSKPLSDKEELCTNSINISEDDAVINNILISKVDKNDVLYISNVPSDSQHYFVKPFSAKYRTKKIKPILKKTRSPSNNIDVRNAKKKQITINPIIVFWDCALDGDLDGLIKAYSFISNIDETNPSGISALHNAVNSGNEECVQFLIDHGSNVNIIDDRGWTPLHYAAYYGETKICIRLIINGANVFVKTYDMDERPVDLSIKGSYQDMACTNFLLKIMKDISMNNKIIYYATHDYIAKYTDELSVKRGENVRVINKTVQDDPEWLLVEDNKKNKGYLPKMILTIYPMIIRNVSKM